MKSLIIVALIMFLGCNNKVREIIATKGTQGTVQVASCGDGQCRVELTDHRRITVYDLVLPGDEVCYDARYDMWWLCEDQNEKLE